MYVLVAVPSEPRNLSDVPRPPSSVDLEWIEPETPNGFIRYYIVRYWRQDGTGNVTELDPVNMDFMCLLIIWHILNRTW